MGMKQFKNLAESSLVIVKNGVTASADTYGMLEATLQWQASEGW